jgi:hypothetical protein
MRKCLCKAPTCSIHVPIPCNLPLEIAHKLPAGFGLAATNISLPSHEHGYCTRTAEKVGRLYDNSTELAAASGVEYDTASVCCLLLPLYHPVVAHMPVPFFYFCPSWPHP